MKPTKRKLIAALAVGFAVTTGVIGVCLAQIGSKSFASTSCNYQMDLGNDVYGGNAKLASAYSQINLQSDGTNCAYTGLIITAENSKGEELARYSLARIPQGSELPPLQIRVQTPLSGSDSYPDWKLQCDSADLQTIDVVVRDGETEINRATSKLKVADCGLAKDNVVIGLTYAEE